MSPALDFALPALATAALLWSLIATGLAWRLAIDSPNARSLHERPTPRVGGVALIPVALAWIAIRGLLPAPVLLGAALLAAVSFADDRRGLPIGVRFGVQIASAVVVLVAGSAAGSDLALPWLALAVIAVVWMSNLYNFMDGSDGLAGGMALLGFGACSLAALGAGDAALAGACAALAGAAAGFLVFNFHPARVFLGDVGSVPLGFLAAVLALRGAASGDWPLWFPVLAFSPFIADASLTLLARALRRERVWRAHREHIYQRMVAAGFGHRTTALCWYGLMAAAGGSGLLLLGARGGVQRAALVAWALAYPIAFIAARRAWRV